MKKPTRLIAAVIAGALSALVPVGLGALLERPPQEWVVLYLYLGGMAYGLSALAWLTIGLLPAHLLLLSRGWDRWWVYPALGAVGALTVYTAFDLWTGEWSPSEYPLPVSVGVVCSVTFWGVVRRPDEGPDG